VLRSIPTAPTCRVVRTGGANGAKLFHRAYRLSSRTIGVLQTAANCALRNKKARLFQPGFFV
jgi:hypothetical protein